MDKLLYEPLEYSQLKTQSLLSKGFQLVYQGHIESWVIIIQKQHTEKELIPTRETDVKRKG